MHQLQLAYILISIGVLGGARNQLRAWLKNYAVVRVVGRVPTLPTSGQGIARYCILYLRVHYCTYEYLATLPTYESSW